MKQFVFCSHNLKIKSAIVTDATVRNFDCISPQKTAIEIPLHYEIENNDIVIIRDQGAAETEYIGIIDTVAHDKTTTILLYPFEWVFDNDCRLESIDGDVYAWIVASITRNYINTGDALNDFPIVFEDHSRETEVLPPPPVIYKRVVESNNLLDNLSEIFINTGIYVKIGIRYSQTGAPEKIVVDVRNANLESAVNIRYDNPIIVDNKVLIERSHSGNYNKAIIRIPNFQTINGEQVDVGEYVNIYLREDNKLTTDPEDPERIKQVKPKLIVYDPSDDEVTDSEKGEAIILLAEKALCGNGFDHSIEFTVVLNNGYDWRINKKCTFTAKDRIYDTYITSVEYLSDRHARVILGAYRYTLTDRFNALRKDDVKADSIKGVDVSDLFEKSAFWFSQDADGNLYLNYPDTITEPPFSVETVDGEDYLVFTDDTETHGNKYRIDSDGNLSYNL